jgi:hypothetical protein
MSTRRCAIRHRPGRENPAGVFSLPRTLQAVGASRAPQQPTPAGGNPSDKLHHSTASEAVRPYFEAARAMLGTDEPKFEL